MALIHPQLSAARARPPVDVTECVSVRERPQVGELDPLASSSRHLVPRVQLRLDRCHETSKCLLARVHLQLAGSVDAAVVAEETEDTVGAHERLADDIASPTLASKP
jgi:hypothetical protein